MLEQAGETETGCREWGRAKDLEGYGMISYRGRGTKAHRLVWILQHGPILDEEQVVRHSCDNRPCINPDHLRIGSRADNQRDITGKPYIMGDHHHIWMAKESASTGGVVKMLAKVGRPYARRGQATKALPKLLRERAGIMWTHVLKCQDPSCPHAE